MKDNQKEQLSRQDKIIKIIKYTIFCIATLYSAFIIFGRLIPQIAELSIYGDLDIFSERMEYNSWLRSLSFTIFILTVSSLLRLILKYSFTWLKHGKSVISLLTSFIKYVAVVVLIFFILASFGVDTTAIVAGIGILSLIVGLAIQPLLQDIIAGIFTVFEKTYDVGDVVVVDNFRGTVVEIGIRATKIKDSGGDIKVINNSDIRTLVNMTGDLSVAICDIAIEYGESLERVEKVLEENLSLIGKEIPAIIDKPCYKGVSELGASGVTLRVIAKCKESAKFQTQRDLNRQLKLLFDANNINIPFAQIVVHQAEEQKQKDKR